MSDAPYRSVPSTPLSTDKPGPLGTLWLLSVLVGPFFGWMIGGKAMGPFTEQSWLWRVVLHAARAVWRVPFLWPPLLLSALISLFSVNAPLDLARGPAVREARVARVRSITGGGRGSPAVSRYLLGLDDGTEVAFERVSLRPGARVRLTWLTSTEVALRVEPLP